MYAASTIAMTAYNLLALGGGKMEEQELFERCRDVQLPGLERPMFVDAMGELCDRGWADCACEPEVNMFTLKDPHCRLVKHRDRSDGGYDDDGNPIGGWGGWLVQCRRQGMISIEDAVNEVAA